MINVCVLSSDKLFAKMLGNELEDIRENLSVCVNQYREGSIVILDLDSDSWISSVSSADEIIGFSRNEDDISKSLLNKCRSVIHRPFSIEDLKNSVKKLAVEKLNDEILESAPNVQNQERLRFEKGCVYFDEKRIGLSENEFSVLKLLNEKRSVPVGRDEINRVLSSSDGNICDVYICRLRAKLEKGGSEKLIFTVRGKGYMLKI